MPLKTNAADGSSMSDLSRKLIFFLLLPQLLRRPCSSPTCIYRGLVDFFSCVSLAF